MEAHDHAGDCFLNGTALQPRQGDEHALEQQLTPQEFQVWEHAESQFHATLQRDSHERCSQVTQATAPPTIDTSVDFFATRRFMGLVNGFVFTTRDTLTGYYQDQRNQGNVQGNRTTLCLDFLLPASSHDLAGRVMQKRPARHARFPDERRRRNKRRVLAAVKQSPSMVLPSAFATGHCELADKGWRKIGLWAIDTVNASSWTSAVSKILHKSMADVLLVQECKLLSDEGIRKAAREARRLGWNSSASQAHRTAANKASGGCAVAARRGIGLSPHHYDIVVDGLHHRFHIAWVAGIVRGGVHCGSLYLRDSEGLSAENLSILDHVAGTLARIRGPWIIGGDWNITPELLLSTNWLSMVHGTIVAPRAPTCHGAVYDFFVVADGLIPSVAGVSRVDDAGLHPHWPTRLLLRGDARRHLTRQMVRPCKIAAVLPAGPLPQPSTFKDAVPSESTLDAISIATHQWYKHAHAEWSSLTGRTLKS